MSASRRSSARLAAQNSSSPPASSNETTVDPPKTSSRKRKAEDQSTGDEHPDNSRKEQKTLEQTLKKGNEDEASAAGKEKVESQSATQSKVVNGTSKAGDSTVSSEPRPEHTEQKHDGKDKSDPDQTDNSAIHESSERKDMMPSNILEKGLIYFFMRGRVGTEHPEGVEDIARSYIVLRPLPQGAKLQDGPLEDLKNNRLIALPKKVLPSSKKDTFMSFVEKAASSVEDLKNDFMQGSSYETKSTGVRHTPPVTLVGEGVYSFTSTGRETHLAYMLTIPSTPGEVQKEIGLNERGSFVTSVKNPEFSGPANTNLPQGPAFPDDILKEFRSLRWQPLQPKHLDYVNTQFLLIGEGNATGELGKAVEPATKDRNKDEKETPQQEMEKLQEEEEQRISGMTGDESEAVFQDLGASKSQFPKVQTTW